MISPYCSHHWKHKNDDPLTKSEPVPITESTYIKQPTEQHATPQLVEKASKQTTNEKEKAPEYELKQNTKPMKSEVKTVFFALGIEGKSDSFNRTHTSI